MPCRGLFKYAFRNSSNILYYLGHLTCLKEQRINTYPYHHGSQYLAPMTYQTLLQVLALHGVKLNLTKSWAVKS